MRSRLLTREAGQAATDTMVAMGFLMLLVFGFVHFCMLAVTRQVVNFAAFGAARTAMVTDVGGGEWVRAQAGYLSAKQILSHTQRWWNDEARNSPDLPVWLETKTVGDRERRILKLRFRVPFGLPIMNYGDSGLVVEGWAPFILQPDAEGEDD